MLPELSHYATIKEEGLALLMLTVSDRFLCIRLTAPAAAALSTAAALPAAHKTPTTASGALQWHK